MRTHACVSVLETDFARLGKLGSEVGFFLGAGIFFVQSGCAACAFLRRDWRKAADAIFSIVLDRL